MSKMLFIEKKKYESPQQEMFRKAYEEIKAGGTAKHKIISKVAKRFQTTSNNVRATLYRARPRVPRPKEAA